MGKRSEQTNMANSFPMQIPQPGISTPNVQGRVARAPVGNAVNPGSPTQINRPDQSYIRPASDAAIAASPVHSAGGFAPRPQPGAAGEMNPSQGPNPGMSPQRGTPPPPGQARALAAALRGRAGQGPLDEQG